MGSNVKNSSQIRAACKNLVAKRDKGREEEGRGGDEFPTNRLLLLFLGFHLFGLRREGEGRWLVCLPPRYAGVESGEERWKRGGRESWKRRRARSELDSKLRASHRLPSPSRRLSLLLGRERVLETVSESRCDEITGAEKSCVSGNHGWSGAIQHRALSRCNPLLRSKQKTTSDPWSCSA